MPRRMRVLETLLAAVVILAVAARYLPTRTLSWTYDDAFLLRVVGTTEVPSYFLSPAFWHAMPAKMFVPLLLVWYEAGSRAGSEANFYLLAAGLLAVALAASYVALRRWLGVVASLSCVALIGLGVPVVSLMTQLMSTHYLIALAFCALSIALYPRRPVLSAIAYLAAMLAKEIAVPLPLILILLPERRTRSLFPHAVAAALYFAWRKALIGVFLGGYGWAVTRENATSLVLSLPSQIAQGLTPRILWLGIVMGAVILVPILLRIRTPRALLAVLIAIAPVLPVSREMQPRYVVVLWVTLAVLFAIASRGNAWLCGAAVLVVAVANVAEWREVFPLAERMSAEARFVREAPADATLRLPVTPPAAMGELLLMRREPGAQAFYDDLFLCKGGTEGRRVFGYEGGRIVEMTPRVAALAQEHCGRIRTHAALRAQFGFRNGILSWRFGPYSRGKWTIVFADGLQAFSVPARDAFILGDLPELTLRIRYDAPQGWTTYSEPIRVVQAHGG